MKIRSLFRNEIQLQASIRLLSVLLVGASCTLAGGVAVQRQASGSRELSFELNQGQSSGDVKFLARNSASAFFFTYNGVVLEFPRRDGERSAYRMELVGANRATKLEGVDPLPGRMNYFIGQDPSQWHRNIPTYARIQYQRAYQGIDLAFYGNQHELEYDFVVAPQADAGAIRLAIQGAHLRVEKNGDLVSEVAGNPVRFRKPLVYQSAASGGRELIDSHYVLRAGNIVTFAIGPYDHRRTLIIDPVISYSTYLGGSDDEGIFGIKRDLEGHLYVSGETSSPNFPTAHAFQHALGGQYDAFVSKFDRSGTHLIYSTYLGGSLYDHAVGLAVDLDGNAYVAGLTQSPDFPTFRALQPSLKGRYNAFVSELDRLGSELVFSTYLGGSGTDQAGDIALGLDGGIYVAGNTNSIDFPVTGGAYQTMCDKGLNQGFCIGDAFVTKLSPGGSRLVYSTYLGGSSYDGASGIAVDFSGEAYVTGQTSSSNFPVRNAYQPALAGNGNAFLTKLNPNGTALDFSTYFGGNGYDSGTGVALDLFSNVYLAGTTSSTNFPIEHAFQSENKGGMSDGFASKFDQNGRKLVYSSYLGGSGWDFPFRIAVDLFGGASVIGFTTSTDFPVVDATQPKFAGGFSDAFVTKISPEGSELFYSTYLGGTGDEFGYAIHSDLIGDVWVGGSTSSQDFPTRKPFQAKYAGGPFDAFLTKLEVNPLWCVQSLEGMVPRFAGLDVPGEELESLTSTLKIVEGDLKGGDSAGAIEGLRTFDAQMEVLTNERGAFASAGIQLRSASHDLVNRIEEDLEP